MEKASLLLDTDQQDGNLNFPHKLHLLLDQNNYPQLIKWKEHGCCFEILDQVQLTSVVLAPIFKQSKWGSFQRQLHVYGFKKLSKGDDKGCFFHPHFLRGREDLLRKMKRFSLLKDLLMNVDHYYYTKFLPHAITRPSPSSVTALAAISRANSGYNPQINRPPLPPPSPNHVVRFQQRPYEATTNPMMVKQEASPLTSPTHLQQQQQPFPHTTQPQQSISPSQGSPIPSPSSNSAGVAATPRFVMSAEPGNGSFPTPVSATGPLPANFPAAAPPAYHLDSNGRPISYNSYFLKTNPDYHQKLIPQQLPPLPPLHQSFLPRSTSAFILSSSSLQSEYMEEHGYSHHSGSMSGGGGGGSIGMNNSRGSFEYSQDRAYSETSSVTPSMITESDSYYTTEYSFSQSADMYDAYYRDPYRLQYSQRHPPPPFIGMMIGGGGGGSSSRADDDEVDELDDEATIDRYIIEYFKEESELIDGIVNGGGDDGSGGGGVNSQREVMSTGGHSHNSGYHHVHHQHYPHPPTPASSSSVGGGGGGPGPYYPERVGYDDSMTAMETMEGVNLSYLSHHSTHSNSSITTNPTPPLSLPPPTSLNQSQRPSVTSSISSSHPNSPSHSAINANNGHNISSSTLPVGFNKGASFPRQFIGNGFIAGHHQPLNHSPTSSALLPPSSGHYLNHNHISYHPSNNSLEIHPQLSSSQGTGLSPPLYDSYPPHCSVDTMEI